MLFGKLEELLILLVIILVLFGAKKLPQLARGIGESVREVRKGFNGDGVDSAEPKKTEVAATTTDKAA